MKSGYIFLLFMGLALLVRLPGLGDFMTVDEELWLLRSGEFWDKLLAKDPAGTFVTTHPGATINWIAGAGIQVREVMLGTGVDTSNIIDFRKYALIPVVVCASALIGLAGVMLRKLFGNVAGMVAGLFVVLDPYLVGMNQIVHADTLLAPSMLASVLAFLVAVKEQDRQLRRKWLLYTGLLTGTALATKMLAAFWLFVFFGFVLLVVYGKSLSSKWRSVVRTSFFVFGVAMLTYVAWWPALWAKGDNLDQYVGNDTASVVTDEHVALEETEDAIEPVSFYGRTFLGRVTPIVQVLALGAVVLTILIFRNSFKAFAGKQNSARNMLFLVVYGVGFLVLITFVAKKSDRYALPGLVAFVAVAGAALGMLLERTHLIRRFAVGGIVIVMLLIQLFNWSPYAIAYNNPLFPDVRSLTQQGWGEGLDAAARWINDQPFDERLHIASWYPSVMSRYFEGRTMSLSSREDHRVGYVVTYRNMLGRPNDTIASDVLDEFKNQNPVHVVKINGVPYAWVYNVLGPYYFRQHVGEITQGVQVGQHVPVHTDNWSTIQFGLATFGRQNTGTITLHVREQGSNEDLRTSTIPVQDIPDQGWQTFSFDEIPQSRDKRYFVYFTSETGTPGNAVTVRYSSEDLMPGNAEFSGKQRDGDLAYRLAP